MRMWMVDPKLLCDKHLLGEHGEIHKHRHNFVKHHRISGRIKPVVQIEPAAMGERHNLLASEMLNRDFNHKSPYSMPDLSYLPEQVRSVKVDVEYAIKDLCARCADCAARFKANN